MGFFGRMFGRSPEEYQQAPAYRGLRQQVLALDPRSIGKTQGKGTEVFGFLLESGYSEAVATLVAILDGSVSLYFSNGGGMIGLGNDGEVRKAAKELLAGAGHFLPHCAPARESPLPRKEHSRFYLLTFGGVHSAEAQTDDLGNKRLPLSPLFLKSHQVISLVREADEKRRSGT